jgi:hypothetical protein
MSKLEMELDPSGTHVTEELRIAAPYEFLVWFISCEVGHSVDGAHEWLGFLRKALAGQPVAGVDGNAWELDADAETATLTEFYLPAPGNAQTLPTAVLLEALERWLMYLEARGYKKDLLEQSS